MEPRTYNKPNKFNESEGFLQLKKKKKKQCLVFNWFFVILRKLLEALPTYCTGPLQFLLVEFLGCAR